MYNITFQQIESFLNVAHYQNFSKAADAMYISQPALSKTLQRFEEGIGLKLFFRSNQGVSLTPEGEYLYSTLAPLYTNIDKTIGTARNISALPPKTLHVIESSTYDSVEDFDKVKAYVRRFEEQHPDVVLVESLSDFKELRLMLEFGDADLALTQEFALHSMRGISYKRVSEFLLYLALSVNHPLAAYDTFVPERMAEVLAEEVFYRVPVLGEEGDRSITIARCHKMGFEPKRIEFVPNFPTLLHKLRTQKGLSLCGKFIFTGGEEVKYIPLPIIDDTGYVVAAWRTGHATREARYFIDLIPGDAIEL